MDLLVEEDPEALVVNALSSGPPRSRGMYFEMQVWSTRRRCCARCRRSLRLSENWQRDQ